MFRVCVYSRFLCFMLLLLSRSLAGSCLTIHLAICFFPPNVNRYLLQEVVLKSFLQPAVSTSPQRFALPVTPCPFLIALFLFGLTHYCVLVFYTCMRLDSKLVFGVSEVSQILVCILYTLKICFLIEWIFVMSILQMRNVA